MNQSGPDPTIVYVVQQVSTVLTSLGLLTATSILAMNHLVQDGEIVTLLVTALGAHVVATTSFGTQAKGDKSSQPNQTNVTVSPTPDHATVTVANPVQDIGRTSIP